MVHVSPGPEDTEAGRALEFGPSLVYISRSRPAVYQKIINTYNSIFIYMYMYVSVYDMHVSTGACRNQKRQIP